MSVESWMLEFIPIKPNTCKTTEEMYNAAYLKWEGAKKENIEKHGLYKKNGHTYICDDDIGSVHMDSDSCAWCMYDSDKKIDENEFCGCCPGVLAGSEVCDKAWKYWVDHSDPDPMIKWVAQAISKIKKTGINCK